MNGSFLNDSSSKSSITKKQIINLCISEESWSIADFSKELNASIPTVSKLVGDLVEDGFLEDLGKVGTTGGRRSSMYGLNPSAGYIAGVDIGRSHIHLALTDFKGRQQLYKEDIPFKLESTPESVAALGKEIKAIIKKEGFDFSKVLGCGVSVTGRVNPFTGYSFSYFIGEEQPFSDLLSKELGVPAIVENDSKAMAFGEYLCGVCNNESNVIFINLSWGLGMGIIINGKLYYGKSGYAGEFGHFPMLHNNQICQCGKVGCLETGASGAAMHRMIIEKLKQGRASTLSEKFKKNGDLTMDEILEAVEEEDVLAIEVMEEIGTNLGQGIAGLINIFNPDLVVIGGRLITGKDYLMLPLKSAVNKLSLNIVNRDTTIKLSKLGRRAGPLGDCLLSRSKLLGLI
jgi:transcriptional regulator of PTS gene